MSDLLGKSPFTSKRKHDTRLLLFYLTEQIQHSKSSHLIGKQNTNPVRIICASRKSYQTKPLWVPSTLPSVNDDCLQVKPHRSCPSPPPPPTTTSPLLYPPRLIFLFTALPSQVNGQLSSWNQYLERGGGSLPQSRGQDCWKYFRGLRGRGGLSWRGFNLTSDFSSHRSGFSISAKLNLNQRYQVHSSDQELDAVSDGKNPKYCDIAATKLFYICYVS